MTSFPCARRVVHMSISLFCDGIKAQQKDSSLKLRKTHSIKSRKCFPCLNALIVVQCTETYDTTRARTFVCQFVACSFKAALEQAEGERSARAGKARCARGAVRQCDGGRRRFAAGKGKQLRHAVWKDARLSLIWL
jgi:hypothetical protein